MSETLKSKNRLRGKIAIADEKLEEAIKKQKKEEKKKVKEIIDKIVLYGIRETDIDFYDGYLIKTKASPEVINDTYFIMGALEMSNVLIDKVLIRMLFIIEKLDDTQIKQKEINTRNLE